MEKNVSKKEPKYVAFSTQKGGGGKNYHYRFGSFIPSLCERLQRGRDRLRLSAAFNL